MARPTKEIGERVIDVILGETPSISQLKRQIHTLRSTYAAPKFVSSERDISFAKSELAPTQEARRTPVVVDTILTSPRMDKCLVKRVLVDTGASKDILYYRCFKEMGFSDHHLHPDLTRLKGFTNHKI